MKKWIWIISAAILLMLGYVIASVMAGMDHKKAAEEEAVETALNKGGLTSVEEYYLYHGSEVYSVVIGPDKDGEKQVLWIPKDMKKDSIKKVKLSLGTTRDEVISKVKAEHSPYKILSAKLGMKEDSPIWEITIKDQYDNLQYINYDFLK